MAQTVKLKRTSVAGRIPTTSNIEVGELAFNTNDKALFIRGDSNAIVALHDESTLHIDTTNNRIGIGSTSPENLLHLRSSSDYEVVFDHTAQEKFRLRHGSSGLYMSGPNTATLAFGVDQNHDFVVFNNSGSAYTTFDGSTSRVGIGTTSPISSLTVLGANDVQGGITLTTSSSNSTQKVGRIKTQHYNTAEEPFTAILTNAQATTNLINIGGASGAENAATHIKFFTASNNTTLTGSQRMVIDSSGNVGIGETSPDKQLHIKDSGAVGIAIESTDNAQNLDLDFYNNSGSVAGRIRYAEGPGTFSFFPNAGATEAITLAYAGGVTFNNEYTFPTSDGTANQVLQTDGSGNLSFATVQAGGGGTVSEAFKNIAVSGQSSVVADGATDTLTLAAGTGMTITTNASSDTVTFAASTTTFEDSDGDTKIQVEESSDEDKIRFDAGGTERLRIDGDVHVIGTTDFNITGASRRFSFTSGTGTVRTTNATSLILATNSTTALTLDSSQNATFAGTLTSGNITTNSRITFDYNGSGTGNNYIETGTNTIAFKNSAGTSTLLLNFSNQSATFNGNIEVGSNNINFADNGKARFGNSTDLQIYHDGSASYIDDTGTGYLNIRGNGVSIDKYTGETMALFVADGAVTLYHNNSAKLATSSSGVSVTGAISATQVGVTNIVTNKVVKFNGSILDDSNITDTGSLITLGSTTTVSGTIKSTSATGLIIDTGAAYRDVKFELTGNTGNGTLEIIPMTVPGSGTATFTTHIKNFAATGTTNHNLKVDGTITSGNATVDQLTVGSGSNIVNAGNMTLDVAGDLTLDADGGDIFLKDGGTQFGRFANFLGSLVITSGASDTAIIIGDNSGNMIVGGDVSLTDNKKLKLGAGNDLQLLHDGTNSVISNSTGDLQIIGHGDDVKILAEDDVVIRDNDDSTNMAKFINGGAVELYHNGVKKLETEANGIKVTSPTGYVQVKSANASYAHIETDRPTFYFNRKLSVNDGIVTSYDEDFQLQRAGTTKLTLGSTEATFTTDILAKDNNSTTNPSITFVGHTDSGIGISDYGNGTDRISIIRDGAAVGYFDQAGISSTANVYTGTTSQFRNYGGTWKGTTGTSGNGFQFINTADSVTAMDLSASGNVTFPGNATIGGNLTVNGTTTTLNTATLDVEDKNITLNKGSGDTSGSADGAGITIQDAVDASNDATILWDASNDKFTFSHTIHPTNILINDSNKIRLGNSQDAEIYHNGTHLYIDEKDSGRIFIRSSDEVRINKYTGEFMVRAIADGAVMLYHNNVKKFETTSTGIEINDTYNVASTNTTTSATTEATIDTFTATAFRSCRYTVQVTNSTDSTYHTTELLLVHDGTTPGITEFGTIFTGAAAEATFDADISSGSVRLRATPASTDSMTFKVIRHAITT